MAWSIWSDAIASSDILYGRRNHKGNVRYLVYSFVSGVVVCSRNFRIQLRKKTIPDSIENQKWDKDDQGCKNNAPRDFQSQLKPHRL